MDKWELLEYQHEMACENAWLVQAEYDQEARNEMEREDDGF
jgi:hypothetical protein